MMRGALMSAGLLLSLAMSGCGTLFEDSDGANLSPDDSSSGWEHATGTEEGRREVAGYLSFTDVLDGTDEQGWHTIYEHTLDGFEEDPTRGRGLRLALVMSRADRKSAESPVVLTMLTDARDLFEDTVNDTQRTPALVRKFAQLQINDIDRRLALYEELRSLRSQLAKAYQASQTAQRDRTEAEARVRRIDAALEEANAKLEAVLNIERNIGPTGKETFP
jgi:hypothetical protein